MLEEYPYIRRHAQECWRRNKHLTSESQVRFFLTQQYDLITLLTSRATKDLSDASSLENHLKEHYQTLDKEHEAKLEAERIYREQHKPRRKGGYIYPTVYNPPLPRMKNQPVHISMMIQRRISAREARIAKMRLYKSWLQDMRNEVDFWRALGLSNAEQVGQEKAVDDGVRWETEINKMFSTMKASFERENAREAMVFTEEEVDKIEKARKVKRRWMAENIPRIKAEKKKQWEEKDERRKANKEKKEKARATHLRLLEEKEVKKAERVEQMARQLLGKQQTQG